MKIKCLFWNIKDVYNNERLDLLNSYAQSFDVIILAEAHNAIINNHINNFSLIQPFQTSGREWIKIFAKNGDTKTFNISREEELFDHRVCISRISINTKKDFFLIGVHLKSKTGIDEKTQLLKNSKATQELFDFFENKHDRAIIVGDFNHNPFEPILNSKITFNSLSNREIVRRLKHRAYLRKSKVIFYNPMWNFIGDHDFQTNMERINGTYYFGEDKHQNIDQLHWNLLDQVLVSQPIINTLSPEDIKIIIKYSNGNKNPLLADKRFFNSTNKSYLNPKYSDHLPIEFSIDTTKLK